MEPWLVRSPSSCRGIAELADLDTTIPLIRGDWSYRGLSDTSGVSDGGVEPCWHIVWGQCCFHNGPSGVLVLPPGGLGAVTGEDLHLIPWSGWICIGVEVPGAAMGERDTTHTDNSIRPRLGLVGG